MSDIREQHIAIAFLLENIGYARANMILERSIAANRPRACERHVLQVQAEFCR